MLDLLDEATFGTALSEPRQAELVHRSCREIEERIRTAGSAEAARRLADDACGHFEDVCGSTLLRTVVRRHAEALVRRHWSA